MNEQSKDKEKRKEGSDVNTEEREGGWKLVQKKRKQRNSADHATDMRTPRTSNFRVMGARKDGRLALKGVKKTADIYLGRVDRDVSTEDIQQYIKEVFNITVEKIENLQIRTDQYSAFKITIDLAVRDELFKPESWPDGIVVNKFYRRS